LAIRQLFADLAILVAAQGEMINNIESNIHSAKEYVFHAEKDLIKAKDNLASARKV
jgi:t-SNARE complex subunit (syntaxin)